MHPSLVFATLVLSASFVGAQCPGNSHLVPKDGTCVCENPGGHITNPDPNCVVTLNPDKTSCSATCPSNVSRPDKRHQLILNEDGSISNCPKEMISCPIDPFMDMGYECISPHEDLDNCGGCVALGKGVSCERVAGVRRTECSYGQCINHSCRSGWVLDKRTNACIPRRSGRNAY